MGRDVKAFYGRNRIRTRNTTILKNGKQIVNVERGGEGILRRSKRRRHLPKMRTFQNSDFFWGGTDRQTDRPTDRQTLWFIGKLHFK